MNRHGGNRRALAAALGPTALVLALAGCGIRATEIPVDDGPAPTRVACAVPGGAGEPADVRTRTRVSLVCSSRVADVRRPLALPRGDSAADRLAVARALLDELRRDPDPAEKQAGFSTAVPTELRISGPLERDDPRTLRLNRRINQLPSFALGQLVCTLADSAVADSRGRVQLGGPADDPARPVLRYDCNTALRTAVQAAESAGEPATATSAP